MKCYTYACLVLKRQATVLYGKLENRLQKSILRIEENQMNIAKTLDAKGLACPMPIVKTKKAMDTINTGEVLEVFVTDKGALSDFPAWATSGGHTIVDQKEENGAFVFYIQKA